MLSLLRELSIGAIAIIVTACLLVGYAYALRFIVQYEITGDRITIKLFGKVAIRWIYLRDVEEVRTFPAWAASVPFSRNFRKDLLFAERWPSYVFQKRGVIVRKRTGLSRVLILSPKDPDEFVTTVLSYR